MNKKTAQWADESAEFVAAYNATIEREGLPLSDWQTFATEDMPANHLPAYEADEGELAATQLARIKQSAPKIQGSTVQSCLVELDAQSAQSLINHDR